MERERRRGRAAALRAQDEALRPLHRELGEAERACRLGSSEGLEHSVTEHRARAVERAYLELQEKHHTLLSRRAANEAELHRHLLEARAAAAADRLRGKVPAADEESSRAWARDGPETEALKAAKVELAEALGLVDEDRLHRRRELRALHSEVEVLQAENARLRDRFDEHTVQKVTLFSSVRRLLAVATGQDDPLEVVAG